MQRVLEEVFFFISKLTNFENYRLEFISPGLRRETSCGKRFFAKIISSSSISHFFAPDIFYRTATATFVPFLFHLNPSPTLTWFRPSDICSYLRRECLMGIFKEVQLQRVTMTVRSVPFYGDRQILKITSRHY